MSLELSSRRGVYVDVADVLARDGEPLSAQERKQFESFDLLYRSACALLYNYVPMSGHPGGSISSGHAVAALVFDTLRYDLADPRRRDADIISYAAGHKALGLYTMWGLRDEVARLGAPELLPQDAKDRLRLEDLLGFRRNPVTRTPLFLEFGVKPLDGHPTPATPFVWLATGASGVGVASSLGLALGAADYYGPGGPRVHIVEGEAGLTPGRVAEALAAAGTASLANAVLHVDWNQSSIDSDRVCREGEASGDYVQWDPRELFFLHDWNVIQVPDGSDFQQVVAAQRCAETLNTGQPTAIVYRTQKGWQYGIVGSASHGAGHPLCSEGFYEALAPLTGEQQVALPSCEPGVCRCEMGADPEILEACFWDALQIVRGALSRNRALVETMAGRLRRARSRLQDRALAPRADAPRLEAVFEAAGRSPAEAPEELVLAPGAQTTLRAELGRVLNYLNRVSGGAVLSGSADLLGSTSIIKANDGFPSGYYNLTTNPGSRLLSIGGICEDAMCGILSGVGTYGRHLGAGSSYGAFIAALGHIAARLHCIGSLARQEVSGERPHPFVLVCAHAGLKTGEDGPTHADPQPLQLLQENFPTGSLITLTPWDPQELWPLMAAALLRRPAVIAPFVTRPNETVLDRAGLGLAPASDAASGVYALRRARGEGDGVVVLQGSGVAYAFVEQALPLLEDAGIDLTVYYVASAELFDLLPPEEHERLFPEAHARQAMGITGWTLPTMYRWVTSAQGRAATLHPFQRGHFLGSGQAHRVLEEAGLDGRSQFEAVARYVGKEGAASTR